MPVDSIGSSPRAPVVIARDIGEAWSSLNRLGVLANDHLLLILKQETTVETCLLEVVSIAALLGDPDVRACFPVEALPVLRK